MFHIVLYQPEIPPNTGNIIRLCANTGSQLHLIEPLGFSLEHKQLIRAGLDYHEFATVSVHSTLQACLAGLDRTRVFSFTTKGARAYHEVRYEPGDSFLFGPESRGLPPEVLDQFDANQRLRVPMLRGVRSLNLSNAAAVVAYEAWRQCGFDGAQELAP